MHPNLEGAELGDLLELICIQLWLVWVWCWCSDAWDSWDNKNAPHTDMANPFLHQVRSQNRIRKRTEWLHRWRDSKTLSVVRSQLRLEVNNYTDLCHGKTNWDHNDKFLPAALSNVCAWNNKSNTLMRNVANSTQRDIISVLTKYLW